MIQMNDFCGEPEELVQQELAAAEKVFRSGGYVLSKEVQNFESIWAQRCRTQWAVGVGNGMDAIEIGLRALEIGLGDEVITTPMTAFATVLAIIRAGATPVLADIDRSTALLDPASVERCLSAKTKAVLLVHLYGQIRNMSAWLELCDRAHIHLLEDCAQSHLAVWQGKPAGSFGTWGAYSFYPTKNLGAIGDAGSLVTNSEAVAHQARRLRNYGQSQRYHHPELGLNSRLDELQAALLSVRLDWLDKFTARRCEIAQAYYRGIQNPHITLLASPQDRENHVYHLFVIRAKHRQQLSDYLRQQGIASLIHYPVPIHHQKPCHHLHCDPKGLANAEFHAAHCVSLPCHPQMSDRDVSGIIEVINAYKAPD